MKIRFALVAIVCFSALNMYGQISDNCVAKTLLTAFSEKAYSSIPVTDQQLDLILKCGIKAPSGHNQQPWKFTVIKDETVMKEIINNAISGNVLIIISGIESESGGTPDFDCGLAAENMFIAAHGLGLAACIYGSPAGNINLKKESFQIPTDYKAVVVLRVGNVDESVDAVTAATPRKNPEEVINYYK
ncbi:MAG TPA: nitroreductase [Bacteroides sp.]|nr:nitroreductase [Bacteroides sp.]